MFMTDGQFKGRQSDLKFVAASRVVFPYLTTLCEDLLVAGIVSFKQCDENSTLV